MFFDSRSLLKLAFTTALALEASALDLQPWGTGHHPGSGVGQAAKRAPEALNLQPWGTGHHPGAGVGRRAPIPMELKATHGPGDVHTNGFAKRSLPPVELKPISDPGVLLRGRSEKREMPGNGCFDPEKHSTFFWGSYGT